jgi:hypothetical protein
MLDNCLILKAMPLDYRKMLADLIHEREDWFRKRDDALRELSRLSELIRSTLNMLPEEQRSQCDALLESLDRRPAGLTLAIRLCFTAGKERAAKDWLSAVEIRDQLRQTGFNFESYKANPLASIHTTLKRMVPHEVECKKVNGQKLYRLKTVEQWSAALAETLDWLGDHKYLAVGGGAWRLAMQNPQAKPDRPAPEKPNRKRR